MKTTLLIFLFGITLFACNEPQPIEKVSETSLELPESQNHVIDSLDEWNFKGTGIR